MLFSELNWNDAEEMNEFVPCSAALSFEKCKSSLADAEELFLEPVLGTEMMERVISIYVKKEASRTEEESKILKLCQRAEANLAFAYNFTELQVRITDQGFQRQVTENFTQTYKYQEDDLQAKFMTKGLNALDNAIIYLENNIDVFEEIKSSVAYKNRKTAIVKDMDECESIYCISQSPLVWLRLQPIIREVEETILPSVIGNTMYEALTDALENGDMKIGDVNTEDLRLKVAKFLVCYAVSMLMKRGGTLTDRGLYFEKMNSSNQNSYANTPAEMENAYKLSTEVMEIAIRHRNNLNNFIKTKLNSYFGGRESEVLNRDNDKKTSVWL